MNLRSKEDNGEAFAGYFSEKFEPVEKKTHIDLRTHLPKIESVEFVYELTIEARLDLYYDLLDYPGIKDYDRDYSQDENYIKETTWVVFSEKPDLNHFQETVKEHLSKNIYLHSIITTITLSETKIKVEGIDEEFTSEPVRN
jgi:hypothetical protein